MLLPQDRIGKMLTHAGTICGIRQTPSKFGQLILRSRVLDVREELAALPH